MPEDKPITERILRAAFQPPSALSCSEWAERNVELDNTSSLPGKFSLELFPCSRFFLECCQNRRTRRITVMVSAQSAKTQNAIIYTMWRVCEKPTPAMWIMAAKDNCEEFAKKRLYPAMRDCPPVVALSPQERGLWTKGLVMFDTMPLMLRGSNSRIGLQSDPIGLIICDERREWKAGAIQLARTRLRTFHDSLEISMGTAGVQGDELDQDFIDGSQTFFHFACPDCGRSQPFRFGKKADALWPTARECGGIVWDETAKQPDGRWDYDEVKKTVRYECENPACRRRFLPAEKFALLKTIQPFHRNPAAFPERTSLHWNVLYMPWADLDWPDVAVAFLKANEAIKYGDPEPLMSFIKDDLGCPWEERIQHGEHSDIMERCGGYLTGQKLPVGPDVADIVTIDRQELYLVWVWAQWTKAGEFHLVEYGTTASYDDMRQIQLERALKDRCVWGDDGGKVASVWRQTALRYGWRILKGEGNVGFYTIQSKDGNYRQGWRQTQADPGIGTINEGRAVVPVWLWSRTWFLDKLYNTFIPGVGPKFEIPDDVSAEFVRQVKANELRRKRLANGTFETFWYSTGPDHYADCMLMQVVVADIAGITRKLPQSLKPAPTS